LVKNKIDGEYDSLEQFISVHFRLLLEEFIYPIRNGIFQYNKGNTSEIKTYDNAKLKKIEISNFKPSFIISFETKKKNLKSRNSLQIGSMILLFHKIDNKIKYDMDPILVLIVNRDKIEKNEITIQPIRNKDYEIINGENYFIFESPSFFPAINPVLSTLQSIRSIPFEDNILLKKLDVSAPKYIDKSSIVDISSIIKTNNQMFKEKFEIDVKKNWINKNHTILDPTQNESMKYILNSKLCLIQGILKINFYQKKIRSSRNRKNIFRSRSN
jgi:hypothetical protein